MQVRYGAERGQTKLSWLQSYHSFSFGDYYDPEHMHFRSLRVLNDDIITAGSGFPTHPHRDAEILTYVLKGALEHKDSMGNGTVIHEGELQRMSAGAGVTHSEFNHYQDQETHFLQIWFLPAEQGGEPSYDQTMVLDEEVANTFGVVLKPNPQGAQIAVAQDVVMAIAKLDAGKEASYAVAEGRGVYLHVAVGRVTVNGTELTAGDALQLESVGELAVTAVEKAEVILFDMA